MIPDPPGSPVVPQTPDASAAWAFILYLAAQAAVLLAALANLQLTARGDHYAAPLAGQLILAAQLLVSAAIFPDLLASRRRAIFAAAVAFPFTQFACHLAGDSLAQALLSYLALLLWLTALACWRRFLTAPAGKLAASAAATLWLLFPPLLWYLSAEFHPNSAAQALVTAVSPILLLAQDRPGPLLLLLALHLAIAAACAGVAIARSRPTLRHEP